LVKRVWDDIHLMGGASGCALLVFFWKKKGSACSSMMTEWVRSKGGRRYKGDEVVRVLDSGSYHLSKTDDRLIPGAEEP